MDILPALDFSAALMASLIVLREKENGPTAGFFLVLAGFDLFLGLVLL